MRTFVQRIAISQLTFKGTFSDPIAVLKAAHRLFQRTGLLGRRQQLDLNNSFHNNKYNYKERPYPG